MLAKYDQGQTKTAMRSAVVICGWGYLHAYHCSKSIPYREIGI